MQLQRNELNFKGENIYVGIDVDLKSWTATVMTEKLEHKRFTQPVDSRKPARSPLSGDLEAIYLPSASTVEDRSLLYIEEHLTESLFYLNTILKIVHFTTFTTPNE